MNNVEYCNCKSCSSIYSESNDWGYWDICSDCNKPIEDSYTPNDLEDEDIY